MLHSTKILPIFVLSIDKRIAKQFKPFKNIFMKLEKNMFTNISKADVNNLVKETKEAIAFDHQTQVSKHSFGTADLWHIQKMKRVRTYRREMMA